MTESLQKLNKNTGKLTLKEDAKHGDILFRFQHYVTSLHLLTPGFTIHWHPEMEFTKITAGKALYTVDFQEYEVNPGDFICVQPNILHSAKILPKGHMISESFVFHLNLLGNSSADICTLRYFAPITDGTLKFPHVITKDNVLYPQLDQLFHTILGCFHEHAPGYELEIKSLLFHFFRLLLPHGQTRAPGSENTHSERMKAVLDFIHTHYAEEITVEDAAKLCCITPSHFMHYFKEKSGLTFNRYLNQYRLEQAALLIKQGEAITSAAFSCGFNNLPYFYKRFHEYYHMTPREFLNNIEKGRVPI